MAEKEDAPVLSRWQRIDIQCRAFANFFYNKQSGLVMGRSGSSWGKIGLFYFIYYGLLAGFFIGCLAIFLSSLNDPGKGGPKTTQFLRGDSAPGLNLVSNLKGFTDQFKESRRKTMQTYLDGFGNSGYGSICDVDTKTSGQKPCRFNQTLLGNCSGLIGNNQFGLDTKKPCAFVKINKIYGWIPKNGNSQYVGLSCTAQGGTVTVHPEGYMINAFPFKGHSFYQTPPVAVIVDASAGKVTVSCRLVADGVTISASSVGSRAFGKIQFVVSA